MPKSFLPKNLHIIFVVLAIFFWLFSFRYFVLVILTYAGFLYLFRQNRLTYQDDVGFKNDVFYAPVTGILKKVRTNVSYPFFGENLTEIQICVLPWQEYGVYLPFTSEVKELMAHRSKRFFRNQVGLGKLLDESPREGLCLTLAGVNGTTIGMRFLQCPFGGWPEIALLPGDRGKRRTNIGFFPYGGTVLLYLPKETQLLLDEGDQLEAGVSVLAGLTELPLHERAL